MIAVEIEAASVTVRRSLARSYGESFDFVPPSTVYGCLLSLVGEYDRRRHAGVKLAFAYARIPQLAKMFRQSSPLKYGLSSGVSDVLQYFENYEILTDVELFCWLDSSGESQNKKHPRETLEDRVRESILHPETVNRHGVLYLGASDDIVNQLNLVQNFDRELYRLRPTSSGRFELPIWVDHVGWKNTRNYRFEVDAEPTSVLGGPNGDWLMTIIESPSENERN